MLEIFAITALVIVGIILIIIEIMFVPGTTIVGVAGVALALIGVYLTYVTFGKTAGHLVLGGSITVTGIAVVMGFRNDAWSRYALNSSIDSKMNDNAEVKLKPGDTGTTISVLRPSGNAEFNNGVFEVHTQGMMLEKGAKIRVISINKYKIIVEPIN